MKNSFFYFSAIVISTMLTACVGTTFVNPDGTYSAKSFGVHPPVSPTEAANAEQIRANAEYTRLMARYYYGDQSTNTSSTANAFDNMSGGKKTPKLLKVAVFNEKSDFATVTLVPPAGRSLAFRLNAGEIKEVELMPGSYTVQCSYRDRVYPLMAMGVWPDRKNHYRGKEVYAWGGCMR
jgi:hypothetical protein